MSYHDHPNINPNTNPNTTDDGKKQTVLSGSAQPFIGGTFKPNSYSNHQAGASQSAGPINQPTGYVSAHQPPGPPMGLPNLKFGQHALPPDFVPQGSQGSQLSHFPIHGNHNNHWRQMPYGDRAAPFHHTHAASDSTTSPIAPRVVLPPSHGQIGFNSQTPTRPRGGGRGQGIDIPPPPGMVPSNRQIITDPRQNVVSSPTFNKYYLPMQSRNRQYPYQGQQHQVEQQQIGQAQMGQQQMGQLQTGKAQIGNPAYTMASQKPQPHPDRHARQRILDEQAKSFSQEDDDAFYPNNV
ncbi:uncharacterized protein F4812DRAFT_467440 [Daldinia caldariorum]|uniref:uncharacterized protein n=1 Tax=Daldinia caldariorum TaxID=326644 RepID=UPI0020084AC7|nr:uncharacterized protein F4812DRAFT_467440 [Daldinia caldariorum]KAI1471297.1 hypothetical protein F4812DRAFT_467440 [Daldinia caldariorum]